jgi:hypothetical protein
MKEVILLGTGESAKNCPIDGEVWQGKFYDINRIPITDIINEFGIAYFRPVMSYMIAHAIYQGYEKIRIYGCDVDEEGNFTADKPRIAFWLGVAKGRGVKVEISDKSRLYRTMKENVKDRYKLARKKLRPETGSKEMDEFMEVAKSGRDPYVFVSGIDKSAITFISRDKEGRVVSEWHDIP